MKKRIKWLIRQTGSIEALAVELHTTIKTIYAWQAGKFKPSRLSKMQIQACVDRYTNKRDTGAP